MKRAIEYAIDAANARAIEYAIDTANALVESLESNDGDPQAILRKLATMVDICMGDGPELVGIIDLAIDKGFDDAKGNIDPDQWTRDELITFAYASIGQFD